MHSGDTYARPQGTRTPPAETNERSSRGVEATTNERREGPPAMCGFAPLSPCFAAHCPMRRPCVPRRLKDIVPTMLPCGSVPGRHSHPTHSSFLQLASTPHPLPLPHTHSHSRSTFSQHIPTAHSHSTSHSQHPHPHPHSHSHSTHAHNTRTQHTHTEHTHTHTHTRTPAHTHTRKAAAALTLNPLALCSDTQRVRNVSTGALSRLCSLLGPGEDSRKPKRSRARTTFALMIEARVLARVATGGARGLIPHQTRALDGARKESH